MSRPKIHDEALRVRLLDATGVLLAAEGPHALSVRRVATEVGTSTTAVYSLFGNKAGLLRAVFVEAFTRFGAHVGAVERTDDPLADIAALGRAYRTSATDDPHLYTVMFGSPIAGFEPQPEDWAQAAATFDPLLDAVSRAIEAGLIWAKDPGLVATAMWANVHGLVSLELRNAMPPQASSPADVFETAIRANLRGWTESGA